MLSYAVISSLLSVLPPTSSGFNRMAFGTLAFAGLLLARPETRAGWRDNWAGSALIGLFFAGDIWIWHRAIEYIGPGLDRKSTRLNSSHVAISYAVFCLKKKTKR